MRRVALLLPLLAALGCTQWGTSALRTVDVWWACPDRYERCEPERAALTLVQAHNTVDGAWRDLRRAEASGRFNDRQLGPLREAIARASEARKRVRNPPVWDDALADLVQAGVDAERAAEKLYRRLYG